MRQLERNVLLNVIDRKWREHLYEMDYLKEGIGLRAMAQRDPLVEYQREGYDMFVAMLDGLKEESVGLPVQRRGRGRAADGSGGRHRCRRTWPSSPPPQRRRPTGQVATKERPTGVQAKGIGGGERQARADLLRSGRGRVRRGEALRWRCRPPASGGTRGTERREAARQGPASASADL